jgi:hypothetical protein
VVAGHREHRRAERVEEAVGPLVLVSAPAVGEVAGGDDQLRAEARGESSQCLLYRVLIARTRVEVGNMQDACSHERMRL